MVPQVRPPLALGCVTMLAGCLSWMPATPVHGATDENIVGFVLEISGAWLLEGNPPRRLVGGDKLPAGASLRPELPGQGASIVVCLYTGKAERYDAAIHLPDQVDTTQRRSIWQVVMGRYRGGLVRAVSRGTELLKHGVLRLHDGQLQLGPSLGDLPAGRWQLQLAFWTAAPTDANQSQNKSPVKRRVSWDPEDPSSGEVSADDLQPGLYELSIVNERSGRAAGQPAIVLLCTDSTYEAKRMAFDEAVALTQSWDEKTRQELANRFLQACLEALVE